MSETIEGIRYDGWELIIDVTGGGVAEAIPRGLSAEVAASRLRHLAMRLDRSVEVRAELETILCRAGGACIKSSFECRDAGKCTAGETEVLRCVTANCNQPCAPGSPFLCAEHGAKLETSPGRKQQDNLDLIGRKRDPEAGQCPVCKGARQICVGTSGLECDGNAPIFEVCDACAGTGTL